MNGEDRRTAGHSVQKLEIWQKAMTLAERVYATTRRWPESERYGLIAQSRRAAVSIPANLAEGIGRGTPPERTRFGQIAMGSLYELATLLELARRLGYLNEATFLELEATLSRLARRIHAYMDHWRQA